MADIEFRVLGTSEVLVDGSPLAIDPPKQRALLTLFLIHHNEVLPTDRILDALWGEEAPASGVSTLRYHVSKLRSALGSHADLIASRESGYELVIAPEAIDSHRFETLLRQAQEMVVTDPIRASELCHHALELWRGPAFVDFPYEEFVQAEARRLDEMRLEAIELRIAALVAAGQDVHLVPELESLVAEHPLRESLWSHLMLVLYRSGRQPEALRAYQRARQVFGDLGTEPSEDLAALEEKILLRDPSLTAEPERVTGNLPVAASHFVGRAEAMRVVQELVLANRLVSIVGPGGVGKTRLAIEAARNVEDHFGGGAWLVDYVAIDEPGLVISQVASALGVAGVAQGGDPLDHLAARIGKNEALLVFDNCEHLVESIGLVLSTLLARCPQLCVLATSRRSLDVEGEVVWRAAPMSIAADGSEGQPEALQLFAERARAAKPDWALTAESEELALEVCRRLGGLPLAIELAAARLRMMSLEQLHARLDDAFAVLTGGPRDKPDHQRGLRALLDWSYELLKTDEQRFFRFVSVFRGGFTLDSAEYVHELIGASRNEAWDLVGALVDSSLLTMAADDRYTMLEPIRQYGLVLLNDTSETEAARDVHLSVLRQALYLPETVIAPLPGQIPTVFGRFGVEIDNARAAVVWALDKPDLPAAMELGATVCELLKIQGLPGERHDLGKRLLAVTSEPSVHRAKLLRGAVYLTASIEGYDKAVPLVDELAATAEALDDDIWRAMALGRRGVLEFLRGDTGSAWRHWDDAADLLLEVDSGLVWHPLSTALDVAMVVGDFERVRRLAARVDDTTVLPDFVRVFFLRGTAYAAAAEGDVVAAEEILTRYEADRSPAASRAARDDHDIRALISLARMDLDDVEQRATAILERGRPNLPRWKLNIALVLLGIVQFHRRDKVVARRYFAEGLTETSNLELRPWQFWFLLPLAATFADTAPNECLTLLAAINTASHQAGWIPYAGVAEIADEAAVEARSRLTFDEIAQAEQRGAAMTLDEAIELALSYD